MPGPTQTAPRPGAKQNQPAGRPFRAGVQSMEDPQYSNSYTLTAGTHDMPDYTLNGDGFLRRVIIDVTCVTAANAAAVTFAQNGPFNTIDTIQFLDTAGRAVYGPFDGYTAMITNKFGGYYNQDDPRSDVTYSTTAGSGGTGGSFHFILTIPLEIVGRDGLGSLVNKNTAVPFRVKLRLAASATPYGTAPTTPGTVTVNMVQDNWWQPEATDPKGHPLAQNPPAVNTTQFWASNNYPINSGNVPGQQLSTGLGYPFRNLLLMFVDSTASRANGDGAWPSPVTFTVEKNQLFQRSQTLWKSRMSKAYGLYATTADTAHALENGVYPIWFNDDFDGTPGHELRNGYLLTRGGQNMLWTGNVGATGTPPYLLYTIVNYVAAANGDPASLAMGSR